MQPRTTGETNETTNTEEAKLNTKTKGTRNCQNKTGSDQNKLQTQT